VTMRHRTGESGPRWTVKLPDGAAGSALVRRELLFDAPPDEVPADARDLVRAYVRSRPLVPVARLHTDRTLVTLRDADDRPAADVVDDIVSVYDGERLASQFREVEVESHTDGRKGARLLHAAVARLVDAGCQANRPIPKVTRALGPRAEAPPDVVVIDIDPGATAGQLVRHALSRSVAQMLGHDPGVRLGEVP